MKGLFRWKTEDLLARLIDSDRETVLYKLLPHFFLELMKTYFRVQVEGGANIPKRGPALILPNHSGVSGFDAMVLQHEITRASGRYPRVLTHHLWFLTKTTAIPARKLGFIEATTENGLIALRKKQLVMLFPEGEYGNFKPSSKAYQLQEFKRGFVRMALETQSPIVPTLILGAEETHVNLSRLKLTKFLRGVILPLPLNVIPLPSKWKIIFMEPIHLPYERKAAHDCELVKELAEEIQERMQDRLNEELAKRDSVFI
ncbi:MAG TPA: lysophospholipid acyltransferase family protein [Bdellovibrionales bacterium]|nr:lysophospholipid acyltransferase family protein [Bdellovibrionales bacterium]